jgi:hypothetical protein
LTGSDLSKLRRAVAVFSVGESRPSSTVRKTALKASARLALGKTQAKPHRHVASSATVREIAHSLGLTAKDLAAGSALVDRLGLVITESHWTCGALCMRYCQTVVLSAA